MRKRLVISLLTLAAASILLGGSGAAAKKFVALSCSYVEAGPPGPAGNVLRIDGSQAEEDTLALRRSGDEIEVFDQINFGIQPLKGPGKQLQCSGGTPTVTNVDRIAYRAGVNVGPSVELNLEGGALAPGATDEGDGSSEIEISFDRISILLVEGSSGGDDMVAGRLGKHTALNLDAGEARPDADLLVPLRFEMLTLLGLGGDDRVSSSGGGGLGPLQPNQLEGGTTLVGGRDDDVLIGSPGSDDLAAGIGDDTLKAGGGHDLLLPGAGSDSVFAGSGKDLSYADDGEKDRIGCGPAVDFAQIDGRDITKACENVSRRKRIG
jgi:hypothetical protein